MRPGAAGGIGALPCRVEDAWSVPESRQSHLSGLGRARVIVQRGRFRAYRCSVVHGQLAL